MTILEDDVIELGSNEALDVFANSTILITGATGLIGSLFVKGLLKRNDIAGIGVRVLALSRSRSKARNVFGNLACRDDLVIVEGSTLDLPTINEAIDWISHGASMTSSADFAAKPVEVALTEIEGSRAVLELARSKHVRGMVYLSSLEVYGQVPEEHGDVLEDYQGPLAHLKPRNSYPTAKRMVEALCAGYAAEYGVPVRIARLAQTFGAGIAADDRRVFADFSRKVIAGQDIVMHTPGTGCRCYCYTTDAIAGLATILAHGESGTAYNLANESTYCSVRDMAEMLIREFGAPGTKVAFDVPDDIDKLGYAAPSCTKLSSEKLRELGWAPKHDLTDMFARLIESIRGGAFDGLT